jgi:diacylglycerol kinase family enzyme
VRILLVVNSFASSVTARNTVLIRQALRRHHDVDLVETNRRGHATRFAQNAALQGLDVVVALGGDGTLNEVANGLAGTGTAVAVLPGGSTNVFARTLGMPNDPVAAAQVLVRALDEKSVRRVGLGLVNGRYFCFHTGIGFDAAVVRAVERRASIKRWAGHPLFIWSALQVGLGEYDRKRPHFTVTAGDGPPVAGYFTLVMNTDPYTFLGNRPLSLVEEATLDRGLVAVTFETLAVPKVLQAAARALRARGIAGARGLRVSTDLETVLVEGEPPFPYQLDGDYLGETRRLSFHHVPEIVDLVVPVPDVTD